MWAGVNDLAQSLRCKAVQSSTIPQSLSMKAPSLNRFRKQTYLASTIAGFLAVCAAVPVRAQFSPGPNPIDGLEKRPQQLGPIPGGPGTVNGTLSIDGSAGSNHAIRITGTGGTRTIVNNGTIENLLTLSDASRAIRYGGNGNVSITVTNNNSSALIRSVFEDAFQIKPDSASPPTNATFNNYGTIKAQTGSNSEALDWGDALFTGSKVINNYSGALIQSLVSDAVKIGTGATAAITNSGTIEGQIHGIGGNNVGASITNQAGGVIRGKGGSGVNIDTTSREVMITNHGTIEGLGADPDGVDVDWIVSHIYNSGIISGFDSSPNAEGISIGGGDIVNLAGGLITGGRNGILVNNSTSGGPAFGRTTLTNHGVIKKSGLVEPSWAIQLTGTWSDEITNTGVIQGTIDLGDGDDTLTITGGNNVGVASPTEISGNIIGGAGTDKITVNVPENQILTYQSPYQISGFETLTKTGLGTLDLRKAIIGSIDVEAMEGTLIFNENQTLGSLTIGSGTVVLRESAAVLAGGPLDTVYSNGLQVHGTVSMTRAAVESIDKLDVTNNALIVQKNDSINPTIDAITARIRSGLSWDDFDNYWNGEGINSSVAAGDTTYYLSAVGVVDNSLLQATEFEGVTGLTGNEVLVRYTLYGDADLDGIITAADYSLIDTGYALQLQGWVNGDFNYDGVIDGTDYWLIDNAYSAQN